MHEKVLLSVAQFTKNIRIPETKIRPQSRRLKTARLSFTQLPFSISIARFFLVQLTKTGKNYQMTIKYTKWPNKISNG
jgi:hypothetical protein